MPAPLVVLAVATLKVAVVTAALAVGATASTATLSPVSDGSAPTAVIVDVEAGPTGPGTARPVAPAPADPAPVGCPPGLDNHGEHVSGTARGTTLTGRERGRAVSEAARSDCGKKARKAEGPAGAGAAGKEKPAGTPKPEKAEKAEKAQKAERAQRAPKGEKRPGAEAPQAGEQQDDDEPSRGKGGR